MRLVALALVGLAALSAVTYGLTNLRRAAPVVDANTVWTAKVERGEMLRQVRGNGTLVPAEVRWIPAPGDGRVEKIELKPGAKVTADTVLVELSNPVLQRDLLDAKWQLDAAEAGLKGLQSDLKNKRLDEQEQLASVEGQRHVAKLQAERDQKLFDQGLLAQYVLDVSNADLAALEEQVKLKRKRLAQMEASVDAELAVQKAKVEQFRALVKLRQTQLDALTVRAGTDGVLQQVMVEVGQQVTTASTLAKVARVDELKAELGILETQARDVQVGQNVSIDTRNGIVKGKVERVDPAVVNGNVKVEVTLEGKLPKGARPDLSVEGTVELERLPDVLHVTRPVGSQDNTNITLFRVDPDTGLAKRVPVKLGRGSVNQIEIINGLNAGDEVVVSDMSKWENVDAVQLK